MSDAVSFLRDNWGITLIGAVTLIQISPLKIDPWSALAKWIKNSIGIEAICHDIADLKTTVKETNTRLENAIKDSEEKMMKREAITVRMRILRFSDEILHGMIHSKEHYDQILSDVTYYEKYCDEHPNFKNNITVASVEAIKNNYNTRLINNDFLK